jgi:hypothetical protein
VHLEIGWETPCTSMLSHCLSISSNTSPAVCSRYFRDLNDRFFNSIPGRSMADDRSRTLRPLAKKHRITFKLPRMSGQWHIQKDSGTLGNLAIGNSILIVRTLPLMLMKNTGGNKQNIVVNGWQGVQRNKSGWRFSLENGRFSVEVPWYAGPQCTSNTVAKGCS